MNGRGRGRVPDDFSDSLVEVLMKMQWWLAFVIGAVLSWGFYVPVLHEGQTMLGKITPGVSGSLRAFLCVGVAYFLTAVVIPLLLIFFNLGGGEKLEFNTRGATFATLGGVAGAAGALCIILSIKSGGSPLYIAPLVFAGAPIVNALVSMAWHPPAKWPGPLFYLGIIMAAVGAGLVLYSKPPAAHGPAPKPAAQVQPADTVQASLPSEP
jgi:hypothetical protein